MYVRVLQDELQFPDDKAIAIDQDTKSLIRGVSFFFLSFFFFLSDHEFSLSYCSAFLHFVYVNPGLNDIPIFL